MHPDIAEGFEDRRHRDVRAMAASLALQGEVIGRDAGKLRHLILIKTTLFVTLNVTRGRIWRAVAA